MYHLDNTSGVPEMPEPKEQQSVTPRWFGESQEQGGISWPGADWFNIVQAELLNILIAAGITPDKTAFDQLAKAISVLGDSKIRQDLASRVIPGASLVKTKTGRTVEESVRAASGASHALFPLLMAKLSKYRYSGTPFRIYGFGSSVGVPATLPNPATQAPVAKFFEYFNATVNRGNIYPVEFSNKSVNGSSINNFLANQWPEVVASGVYPDIALFIYGMNDFPTANYNAGQTFGENGFKNRLRQAIRKVREAGGDVVLTTTPHPLSTDYSWSMPAGVSQSWPWSVSAPVPDDKIVPSASDSIVNIEWNGVVIPAAARFLRGNDAIRDVAVDMGCVLVDVAKYWFDAVAKYGESLLFNAGQNVHPNEFGHQQSYWLAFQEFFANVDRNGWTAPTAIKFDLFEVGGSGLYPNPKTADIDFQANNIREWSLGLRDRYSRLLSATDQLGKITRWSYTSQSPTTSAPGYSLQWSEYHSRTGGVYQPGDIVSVPIETRTTKKLFIDVWAPGQFSWAQAAEVIAVNREGVVSYTVIGHHDNTPGGNRLFTLSAGDGVLNITALLANSSVKYHISGFN